MIYCANGPLCHSMRRDYALTLVLTGGIGEGADLPAKSAHPPITQSLLEDFAACVVQPFGISWLQPSLQQTLTPASRNMGAWPTRRRVILARLLRTFLEYTPLDTLDQLLRDADANTGQMAELFDRDQSVVSRHIRTVFREGELDRASTMQKMHIANSDNPVSVI